MEGLQKAIKAAGSQAKLGRALGITGAAINNWKKRRNGVVPADYVTKIEALTGVSRVELRPDLFTGV